MAEVLLTHSYHLLYDRKQVIKRQPYPPLGTLYAAALLRANGISVGVFDTMLNDPAAGFAEALRAHRPSIVAIYEDDFNFLTKMCLTRMREVAWAMIEEAQRVGARVVVHGSDATDHAREYLERGAEFVLVGAAEETLLNVTRAMLRGMDPTGMAGAVSARSVEGLSSPRPTRMHLVESLAHLPFPARDLVDIGQYRGAWRAAHGHFSLNMVASRGCPFRCNWCAKPIFGDNFSIRPAEEVAREMQTLKEEYGADHIWFADDIFGLNRYWVRRFADEVERLGRAVTFKVQARADLLTVETVKALRRAGCTEVWMGVESGSQKILDAMDKGLRVEEVMSARKNLAREGIRACYFLQLGYPGESWGDIQKTVNLVRETRPDDIGVSFSYPLPNTKFYDMVQKQLGAKRNWSDSDDLCVMFKGRYTDQFYRSIRDALHREVDSRSAASASRAMDNRKAEARWIRQLWREIEQAEPLSRNADPTELDGPHRSQRSADLVSIRPMLGLGGEV